MLGSERRMAPGAMWMADCGGLRRCMRGHPGSGLTGERPESADVQVKCRGTDGGFPHTLAEARVECDKGSITWHI